jgi:hypothetical protein
MQRIVGFVFYPSLSCFFHSLSFSLPPTPTFSVLLFLSLFSHLIATIDLKMSILVESLLGVSIIGRWLAIHQ